MGVEGDCFLLGLEKVCDKAGERCGSEIVNKKEKIGWDCERSINLASGAKLGVFSIGRRRRRQRMFKNLFGGKKPEKKEAAPAPAPPSNPIGQTAIDFEKVTHQVMQQEQVFEQKIDKYTNQIERLKGEAKTLVAQGKKKNAMFKLQEIQQLEKYIVNAENQKQVFFKVRIQLQNGQDNKMASE